jgi:hypothetical protein
MEIAIAIVFTVFGVVAFLASLRDLRTMNDYREWFSREVGDDAYSQLPAADRRSAKRELRRGKAVSNPAVAAVVVHQYEAVGLPPDFTRRSRLVGIAGTSIICALALAARLYLLAIGAAFLLLVCLAASYWKWRLSRSLIMSVVATRHAQQNR